MKRLAIILLAAAIGLGVGAAVVAQAGGAHRIPLASPVASQKEEALQQDSRSGVEEPEDDQKQVTRVAPCDPQAMLPVISEAIDPRSDLGRFWESVEIKECQNGYARVFAVTGGPPTPPGTQLEGSEQVFLQEIGGEWKMLSSGSGLDCYPGSMPPDLKDACEALGLP
jgi:hypothetical protein